MVNEEVIKSPQQNSRNPPPPPQKSKEMVQNGERKETLFSPRFRSMAEMAGWDEEALMMASLIVEDTPDRNSKQKKRPDLQTLKTPPTNSRRKRRAQRRSPSSLPVVALDLEVQDDEPPKESETKKEMAESTTIGSEEKKRSGNESYVQGSTVSSSSSAIPCIDRLREELSCAICLEICFEPSTTPCGHSFCKKCLRSAADKCGKKCPKCRQLISNGRSSTVNTVLWNTIQLLFPQEVEARKAAGALTRREAQHQSPARLNRSNARNRTVLALNSPESGHSSPSRRDYRSTRRQSVRPSRLLRRRNELPSQDEDAALALRLQREEYMGAFRGSDDEYRSSLTVARANLRAMASRVIRVRGL
ncbi:hypothetical protein ACH5RR_014511 [Cinchona calisaya]|uniref:RING-type E3 ubiquitin transferase n=1 Tax=Cinchona calisaya TaxID=153742 RepID=A0ABD3A326_9GENT